MSHIICLGINQKFGPSPTFTFPPIWCSPFVVVHVVDKTFAGNCISSYNMPSLRRTASNPSVVRSSPYRSLSSLAGAQVARSQGRRRSSGSDITSRRVLADIDWWTVTDGQCENGSGDYVEGRQTNDDNENNVTAGVASSNASLNLENGVDHLFLPAALWRTDDVRDLPFYYQALDV